MGQNQSIEEIYITKNYLTFVKDVSNDMRFGAFKLYQHLDNNQYVQIQSKIYYNNEESQKMKENCKNRQALNSDFVLKLIDYTSAKEKEYCSSYKRIMIVYEYIDQTLYDVFTQRQKAKISKSVKYQFKEKEIWYLLRSILNALSYLKFNNARLQISPLMFNVMLDNYGRVKINDGFLQNVSQQIYQYLLVNRNQLNMQSSNPFKEYIEYYFPSPQILSNLESSNPSPIHQPSKNEVFSLAMTILQLTSSEKLFECYDYQQLKIDMSKIQQYQKHIEKYYSEELCEFLGKMLVQDEIDRLDIDDLMDIIENYENASQIQIGAINQLTKDPTDTEEMNELVLIQEEGKKSQKSNTLTDEDKKSENSKKQSHKERQKKAGHNKNQNQDEFQLYQLKDYNEPTPNGPFEEGILPQLMFYDFNVSFNESLQNISKIQQQARQVRIDNPKILQLMQQQKQLQQQQSPQLEININNNSQQPEIIIQDLPSQDPNHIKHQEQSKQAKKVKNINKNLQQLVENESPQKQLLQEQEENEKLRIQQEQALQQQQEYEKQLALQQLYEQQQYLERQQELQNYQNSQLYLKRQHQENMKKSATEEYNDDLEEDLRINNSSQKANQLYIENYNSQLNNQQQTQIDYQYIQKSPIQQQQKQIDDFNSNEKSYLQYNLQQQQQQQQQQQFQMQEQSKYRQTIYDQLWPFQYIQDTNFPTERPSNLREQRQQIFT